MTDVESYGMSGNLLFDATVPNPATLAGRITERLGATATVRTRLELARIVAQNPFRDGSGPAILFLAGLPTAARRRALLELDFESPRPVLRGKTVFFVHPARPRGKRSPVDFERVLDVQGTARSPRVVERILVRMSGTPA